MKRFTELVLQQHSSTGVQTRLHVRNDLHLARKAWHMFMGLMIALIYQVLVSAPTGVLILGIVLAFDVLMEMTRLKNPEFNRKIIRCWGPVMRNCEVNRMSGIPYYLLANLLAIGIFPKPVAILSILYLAIGDPVASLFGILFGDRSIRFPNGKSLIGTLAGIAACTVAGLVFLRSIAIPEYAIIGLSLIGGIAGGTAELLPFETDDNFTIPIVSGFILWLAFILFGL